MHACERKWSIQGFFFKWRVLLIETLSKCPKIFCGCIFTMANYKTLCTTKPTARAVLHIIWSRPNCWTAWRSRSGKSAILAENSWFEAGVDFLKTVISFQIDFKSHPACSAAGQLGERISIHCTHTQSWKGATMFSCICWSNSCCHCLRSARSTATTSSLQGTIYETCLIS